MIAILLKPLIVKFEDPPLTGMNTRGFQEKRSMIRGDPRKMLIIVGINVRDLFAVS